MSVVELLMAAWLAAATGNCPGYEWSDPAGDQIAAPPGPAFDLVGIRVFLKPDVLSLELTFNPATATSDDLLWMGGYLDLDTDMNLDTWEDSHIDQYSFGDPLPMGVDYYLSFDPGWNMFEFYEIVPGFENFLGFYPVEIDGMTVKVSLPRCNPAPCEGIDIGARFRLSYLIGNGYGWTDRAPNGDVPYIAVPAPSDIDEDGDVDSDDLDRFKACMTGPGVPQPDPSCRVVGDLDGDSDVDQTDFGIFQMRLTGHCN